MDTWQSPTAESLKHWTARALKVTLKSAVVVEFILAFREPSEYFLEDYFK